MGEMRNVFAFRLEMVENGVMTEDRNRVHIVKLEQSTLNENSRILGMKQKMKHSGTAFMIHCIYGTIIEEALTYLVVSPDEEGSRHATVLKNDVGGQFIGMEAVFIGE